MTHPESFPSLIMWDIQSMNLTLMTLLMSLSAFMLFSLISQVICSPAAHCRGSGRKYLYFLLCFVYNHVGGFFALHAKK